MAASAGADGITLHVREDRRHVREDDLARLAAATSLPINLEMGPTEEMLAIALGARPHAVCLVPERRQERTTEGGLDAAGRASALQPFVTRLSDAGCRVSLFIEPELVQVRAARALGAAVVELHTGRYCALHAANDPGAEAELVRIAEAARLGADLGLEIHAGHGLDFDSVGPVAAMLEIRELNIGHFLIGEAVFIGLAAAVRLMKDLISAARRNA